MWRVVMENLPNKLIMRQADEWSSHVASELCGKRDVFNPGCSLGESGQDAWVTLVDRVEAKRAGITVNKSWSLSREHRFSETQFPEMPDRMAVALINGIPSLVKVGRA